MSLYSEVDQNQLYKPKPLQPGACIGVLSPSFPSHLILRDKFEKGIHFLESRGFKIKLGLLTASFTSEGYRTGTAIERAKEFNELYQDPEVSAIIFSIGGSNSSSILPYIDYEYIKAFPKIVCGYSNITSIHAALNHLCNLCTFYGPAIIPSFGNHPYPDQFTLHSFFKQTGYFGEFSEYEFPCPPEYTNHFIDATKPEWTSIERIFTRNEGWKTLNKGSATGKIFCYNLNTLLALAGTRYFPNLQNTILCLEQMNTNMANEERLYTQLAQMGVFQLIKGLLISKAENFDLTNSSLQFPELLLEVLPKNIDIPIVLNFDCGHTHPMLTIAQGVQCSLIAGESVEIIQHESGFL